MTDANAIDVEAPDVEAPDVEAPDVEAPDTKAPDTKAKLVDATLATLRENGLATLSARTIAGRAEVNQALIFYHFGTVAALVDTAVRQSVDASVDRYRAQFAAATSLSELLRIGRALHERERDAGNVAVMAQLLSGAQHDGTYAAAARHALNRWTTEIEFVLRRLLAGSPLVDLADPPGLARAISAAFVGLELYDGADPAGAASAFDALERLGVLLEVLDDLGAVARRAVRAKLRRAR